MENVLEEVTLLIDKAERIRETYANYFVSLIYLRRAEKILSDHRKDMGETQFNDKLSSILGHTALTYKKLYEQRKERRFLHKLEIVLLRGLELDIVESDKATFHMRYGDLFTIRKKFEEAEESYRKAYEKVEDGHRHGEFLGHWADSIVNLSRYEDGIAMLKVALQHAETYPAPRDWHNKIIICGHLGRLAKAYLKNRQYGEALKSLWKYWRLADELDKKYHKPERKNQLFQMFFKFSKI